MSSIPNSATKKSEERPWAITNILDVLIARARSWSV
jgi:hypothetical protein